MLSSVTQAMLFLKVSVCPDRGRTMSVWGPVRFGVVELSSGVPATNQGMSAINGLVPECPLRVGERVIRGARVATELELVDTPIGLDMHDELIAHGSGMKLRDKTSFGHELQYGGVNYGGLKVKDGQLACHMKVSLRLCACQGRRARSSGLGGKHTGMGAEGEGRHHGKHLDPITLSWGG